MKRNWSSKKIVYELHERNLTLEFLSKQAGLAPSTLKNALRVSYPKGERIIAEAIGVAPEVIWAERYAAREKRHVGRA
ncbi:transcriptional regulator [Pasteurella multocida]|uniref:helix-turn-helix domain-containing protein n=1 Tax=Pasteurella multocida TaxID=747 RepID=UPI000A67A734|nr:helix-turn-helix domain-containing protein [Pasteurella multocida]MDY0478794.1 helix-turn-helix domain-containing protein [Pasteurella multocida]MDY0522349.1 helix-turn-helix domain-containing protein [Pasteurella multocida]MDY0605342.1 helix-turn-helix domain-containing protein [Pasteurella multocida]MDY0615246.1 helix-turn-helix domain-containing protein [Pasteurella multocida]MDY0617596.1 helix-turn-helix domain-containing protein [Pasteurella multocida]